MMKKIFLTILAVLLFALTACNSTLTGNSIASNDQLIQIPINTLSKTASFFELDDNGVKIRYFAVLGSDGKPRIAMDACDVCGGKKGYQQVGNDIKCRNCGRVFTIDSLGQENKGYGCWPSHVPFEIKEGDVFIKESDIKNHKHKFL